MGRRGGVIVPVAPTLRQPFERVEAVDESVALSGGRVGQVVGDEVDGLATGHAKLQYQSVRRLPLEAGEGAGEDCAHLLLLLPPGFLLGLPLRFQLGERPVEQYQHLRVAPGLREVTASAPCRVGCGSVAATANEDAHAADVTEPAGSVKGSPTPGLNFTRSPTLCGGIVGSVVYIGAAV